MNKQEAKEFLSKYHGEEMEFSDNSDFSNPYISYLYGITSGMLYVDENLYRRLYCRPIPEKKKRDMTPHELKGKWLRNDDDFTTIIRVSHEKICLNGWRKYNLVSVKSAIELGWTLEDGSPLEVEEDE